MNANNFRQTHTHTSPITINSNRISPHHRNRQSSQKQQKVTINCILHHFFKRSPIFPQSTRSRYSWRPARQGNVWRLRRGRWVDETVFAIQHLSTTFHARGWQTALSGVLREFYRVVEDTPRALTQMIAIEIECESVVLQTFLFADWVLLVWRGRCVVGWILSMPVSIRKLKNKN